MVAVCVSSMPASVNGALTVTAWPGRGASTDAVMFPATGATFATVTVEVICELAP